MSINFPNSPTLNQQFTNEGTTWIWDGTKWNLYLGSNIVTTSDLSSTLSSYALNTSPTIGGTAVFTNILRTNKIQNTSGADALDFSTSGIILSTPSSTSGSALVDSEYIYTLNANRTIAATVVTSTFYSMFGVGLSVPIGVYRFNIFGLMSTGTTSHTVSIKMGGTATIQDIQYSVDFLNVATSTGSSTPSTPTSPVRTVFNGNPSSAANGVVSPASTIATKSFFVNGIVRVNATGTLNPEIAFSANPTGTNAMALGSYVSIVPVSSTINNNISYGTWI